MTRLPLAAALAAALASPALAQSGESLPDALLDELEREAEGLTEEALKAIDMLLPMIEGVMDRLPLLIDSLPQYHPPELLPNGDIIIRRKRSGFPKPPKPEPPEGSLKL